MDLLQTVRKEGSRGGRGDFKWEDVKTDAQRENYLGHSVMAPVGRWQKNRDLTWYAKGDDTKTEAEARAEEMRKVREAEKAARNAALGIAPETQNANLVPLGKPEESAKEVKPRRSRSRSRDRERRKRHRSRDRSSDRRDKHRRRSRERRREHSRDRSPRRRDRDRSRDKHRHRDRRDDSRRKDHGSEKRHERRDEYRHNRRRSRSRSRS